MTSRRIDNVLSFGMAVRNTLELKLLDWLTGDDCENIDWESVYKFATEHALLGILFQEAQHLQSECSQCKPIPQKLLREWYTFAEKIKTKNKQMNEVCEKLTENFCIEGFDSIILKGQGIAQYYPEPLLRQSGDIDVWLIPKSEENASECKLSQRRDKIVEYVRKLKPKSRIYYHHMDFIRYKDAEIEAHFTPTWLYNPFKNKLLQDFCRQNIRKSSKVNGYEFYVPSTCFNIVYILVHIYRHIFDEGVGLRQLLDYYYVLQNSTKEEITNAFAMIRKLRLTKFFAAVIWVMRTVFNDSDNQGWICKPDEKEGRWLLNAIVSGGNFGRYKLSKGQPVLKQHNPDAHFENFAKRISQSIVLLCHYPDESLWALPWRIWQFCWRKVKRYN